MSRRSWLPDGGEKSKAMKVTRDAHSLLDRLANRRVEKPFEAANTRALVQGLMRLSPNKTRIARTR